MTTIEAEPETTEAESTAEAPVAALTREELFKWQSYVHVGDGADGCEHATDGKCTDERHFHAWIRLPNPFQVRDIEEKARAAQARKRRALRDPESDAYVILEDELESIRDTGDREGLILEIIDRDFQADYVKAAQEVMDIDGEAVESEDEIPKLYGHIDQDIEEHARQAELPEDERDEGFADLERHIQAYRKAVDDTLKAIQDDRRRNLKDLPWDELIDRVRKDRREWIATEVYLHTFSVWQWFVCTFKPVSSGTPAERVWKDINRMKLDSAPEVAAALKEAFQSLERGLSQSRRAKN